MGRRGAEKVERRGEWLEFRLCPPRDKRTKSIEIFSAN
jgi:hypothetical protein